MSAVSSPTATTTTAAAADDGYPGTDEMVEFLKSGTSQDRNRVLSMSVIRLRAIKEVMSEEDTALFQRTSVTGRLVNADGSKDVSVGSQNSADVLMRLMWKYREKILRPGINDRFTQWYTQRHAQPQQTVTQVPAVTTASASQEMAVDPAQYTVYGYENNKDSAVDTPIQTAMQTVAPIEYSPSPAPAQSVIAQPITAQPAVADAMKVERPRPKPVPYDYRTHVFRVTSHPTGRMLHIPIPKPTSVRTQQVESKAEVQEEVQEEEEDDKDERPTLTPIRYTTNKPTTPHMHRMAAVLYQPADDDDDNDEEREDEEEEEGGEQQQEEYEDEEEAEQEGETQRKEAYPSIDGIQQSNNEVWYLCPNGEYINASVVNTNDIPWAEVDTPKPVVAVQEPAGSSNTTNAELLPPPPPPRIRRVEVKPTKPVSLEEVRQQIAEIRHSFSGPQPQAVVQKATPVLDHYDDLTAGQTSLFDPVDPLRALVHRIMKS